MQATWKKITRIIIFFAFFLLYLTGLGNTVDIPYKIYGFFSQSAATKKVHLQVIGKVVEVKSNKRGLLARLFQENITKKGDKLYILKNSGLIIGEIHVKYVFNTLYFGQMLAGTGYFRLIPSDALVASYFNPLLENDDFLIKNYISKGENFFEENSLGQAINYFKKALAIEPANPKALLGLAKCYFSQKLWNVAEKYFNLALQNKDHLYSKEDLCELYLNLADVELSKSKDNIGEKKSLIRKNQRHIQKALDYIKMTLAIAPDSTLYNFYAAKLYYLLNEERQALLHLQTVIRAEKDFAFESYKLIGQIFQNRGMHNQAESYFQRANKLQPQRADFDYEKMSSGE